MTKSMGDTKNKEVEARQSPLNSSANRNNGTNNKTFNGTVCSAETVVVQPAQVPVDVHQQTRVIVVCEHVAAASNSAVRNSNIQCCYPVSERCSSQLYRQLRNASLRTTQLLGADPYEKSVLQQYNSMISWCCARVAQLLTMHPGSGHHPYTVAYRNPGCSSWPMLYSSFASDLFPLCASVASVVD